MMTSFAHTRPSFCYRSCRAVRDCFVTIIGCLEHTLVVVAVINMVAWFQLSISALRLPSSTIQHHRMVSSLIGLILALSIKMSNAVDTKYRIPDVMSTSKQESVRSAPGTFPRLFNNAMPRWSTAGPNHISWASHHHKWGLMPPTSAHHSAQTIRSPTQLVGCHSSRILIDWLTGRQKLLQSPR